MRELWMIGVAGALGAMSRYGLSLAAVRFGEGGWPTSTFVVNLLGCLLLPIPDSNGVVLVRRRRQRQPNIEIRQISDGAQDQDSNSSNNPALLKVTFCCCNGA